MGTWSRRSLAAADMHGLRLTPEEGFVLSRLETPLSSSELVSITGFSKERAERILGALVEKGVVESSEGRSGAGYAPSEAPPAELVELGPATGPPPAPSHPAEDTPMELVELGPATGPPPAPDPTSGDAAPLELVELGPATGPPPPTSSQPAVPEPEPSEPLVDAAQAKIDENNYRKVYEQELRTLSREERLEIARTATGPRLFALCFDLDPVVIRAVVTNGEYGLPHARIAARHHPNSGGLEAIAQRADMLNDGQVQRNLLRNPQLTEALVKRILMPRRMADSYKTSLDTDVPERTRQFARHVLRHKFAVAQGEEKAGIVNSTEGRVLTVLTGLTFDARATQVLCARSYNSVLFIQNLARFAACPPLLLVHLLKQPLVKRQQHLRNLLFQHPNMPSDAKKRL